MQLVLIYLVVAVVAIPLLSAVIRRNPKAALGATYVRACLIWSFGLTAVDLLIFVLFGVWAIPPLMAIFVGLAMAPAMMAMT